MFVSLIWIYSRLKSHSNSEMYRRLEVQSDIIMELSEEMGEVFRKLGMDYDNYNVDN